MSELLLLFIIFTLFIFIKQMFKILATIHEVDHELTILRQLIFDEDDEDDKKNK